jgi:hypothetical protein
MFRDDIVPMSVWRIWPLALATLFLLGCSERREDVSKTDPFAQMVGAQYRVVGDVAAYGIWRYPEKDRILYVTLIPGVGIDGPEVAFRLRVPKGELLSVQRVFVTKYGLASSTLEYQVSTGLEGMAGLDVLVRLTRGNEGDGFTLNSNVYERVDKGGT